MKKLLSLTLLALTTYFPMSDAAVISLDSVSGVWTGTTGTTATGIGTNQIYWGNSTGSGQSSYRFVGNAPIASVPLNTEFTLGDFTHFNRPITGNSITGATLDVTVDLTIDGSPITGLHFIYDFLHDETPNQEPCQGGSVSVCDDIVQITNNEPASSTFNIGGVDYNIKVVGFEVNDTTFESFMTRENFDNSANLVAEISARSVPIPEPTTYLLFGTFLSLAFATRNIRNGQKVTQKNS